MSEWVWLIIVIVLGLVVGNILLLKHSANMKLPKPKHDNNKNWDDEDD